MSGKPVLPREVARQDINEAIEYYLREAGVEVTLRFIDALEAAYQAIGRNPATGSPRYAHGLNLPGLRSRGVGRFPYLIFYMELAERVEVWRVLHAHRDIPTWLQT